MQSRSTHSLNQTKSTSRSRCYKVDHFIKTLLCSCHVLTDCANSLQQGDRYTGNIYVQWYTYMIPRPSFLYRGKNSDILRTSDLVIKILGKFEYVRNLWTKPSTRICIVGNEQNIYEWGYEDFPHPHSIVGNSATKLLAQKSGHAEYSIILSSDLCWRKKPLDVCICFKGKKMKDKHTYRY